MLSPHATTVTVEAEFTVSTAGGVLTVSGLGEAVLSALAEAGAHAQVVRLAVKDMPHSGKPEELLAAAGIDADGIATAARSVVTVGASSLPA